MFLVLTLGTSTVVCSSCIDFGRVIARSCMEAGHAGYPDRLGNNALRNYSRARLHCRRGDLRRILPVQAQTEIMEPATNPGIVRFNRRPEHETWLAALTYDQPPYRSQDPARFARPLDGAPGGSPRTLRIICTRVSASNGFHMLLYRAPSPPTMRFTSSGL